LPVPSKISISLDRLGLSSGRATLFLFAILFLALRPGTIDCAALGLSADLHTWEMIDLVVGGIFGPLQFAIDDVALSFCRFLVEWALGIGAHD